MSNMTRRFPRIAALHAQIGYALQSRQALDPRDYDTDPTFRTARYLMAVYEGLMRDRNAMSADAQGLRDVMRREGMAAGRVGYPVRLAFAASR